MNELPRDQKDGGRLVLVDGIQQALVQAVIFVANILNKAMACLLLA